MSADSLLQFLATQTRNYQGDITAEEDRQRQQQVAQSASVEAQRQKILAQANEPTALQKMSQESGQYSEAKLREQQGRGLAATGNAYSDARLRDQLGMPPAGTSPAHPLENYLGGVQSQDEYRPAMLQYLASGGKKPKWFTGNYEVDKPNIEAAISATMTPKEQAIRQEAQTKMVDLEEARQARIQLAKEVELRRSQDAALKREGIKAQASIPKREDRLQALQVLGGILGEGFGRLSLQAQDAAAAKAASIAKAKVGTPEAQGVDFESLLSDAYNEMISKGELRMPQAGSFFNLIGSGPVFDQPAAFKPGGMAQPAPQAAPKAPAPAAPKAGEVQQGYRFKGGNPADPKSWEKV